MNQLENFFEDESENQFEEKISLKEKRKEKARSTIRTIEPLWDSSRDDERGLQLLEFFNFYNNTFNDKDSREFLFDFFQKEGKSQEFLSGLLLIPSGKIPLNVGWIARMKTNMGDSISERANEHFETWRSKIDVLSKHYFSLEKEKEERKKVFQSKSIQERVEEKTRSVLGAIEANVDQYLESNFKDEPKINKILSNYEVSPLVAGKTAEALEKQKNEIVLALKGKDEQLKEGYSNFTGSQKKKLIAFYDSILSVLKTWKEATKKVRKSKPGRKKRKKDPAKVLKKIMKVPFLKEFKELDFQGVPISRVVGAQEAWTYDTKTKKLSFFKAMDSEGLFFSGKSIRGYDKKKSLRKNVRKPKEVIPGFKTGKKPYCEKVFKSLVAKENAAQGKFSESTLILKVFN